MTRAGVPAPWIAALIAVFPIGTFVAGPLWGWVADRGGRPIAVLRLAAVVAASAALLLVAAPDWRWMLPASLLLAVCRAPLIPIADVLTVEALGSDRASYGRIRLWGSIAFAAAVAGVSLTMASRPRANLEISAILLVTAAALAWGMPNGGEARPVGKGVGPLDLLRAPALRRIWPICLLHGLGVATYDHLFALRVEQLSLPPEVTGRAVAFGIVGEVIALAAAPWLLRRAPPLWWVFCGVAGSVPRWWLTGTWEDPWALSLLQGLHGVTYGLWWVGGMPWLASHAPAELRHSAQSFFIAVTHGASTLIVMAALGPILGDGGTGALFRGLVVTSGLATVLVLSLLRAPRSGVAAQPA